MHFDLGGDVDTSGRLVQHDHVGRAGEPLADGDLLLVSSAEGADRILGVVHADSHSPDELGDDLVLRPLVGCTEAELVAQGPGFFGVVTRFHLRLYRRPAIIGARLGVFPVDKFEEILRWCHRVGPEVPTSVELMFVVSPRLPNTGEPGILLIVAVFADSQEQAADDLSFFETRPEGARQFTPFEQMPLGTLTRETMSHYPEEHFHVVDNMWTHASAEELLPALNRIRESLPEPPAHFIWMNWSPKLARANMAFSLEDEVYIAMYGLWKDPVHEVAVTNWVLGGINDLSPYSSGIQLADENLARRDAIFMAETHRERLKQIRRERDPAGRFHTYGCVTDEN